MGQSCITGRLVSYVGWISELFLHCRHVQVDGGVEKPLFDFAITSGEPFYIELYFTLLHSQKMSFFAAPSIYRVQDFQIMIQLNFKEI